MTAPVAQELLVSISELIPAGGRVLQIGNDPDVALALAERFELTLMDSSMLECVEKQGRTADLLDEDPLTPGLAAFDLVLRIGEASGELLHGMTSRSRRFVLVVTENPHCYWHMLWRARQGTETLATVDFAAAGVTIAGQRYFGEAATEHVIAELAPPDIRDLHRSAALPLEQRAWLVAALGCVSADCLPIPKAWTEHLSAQHRVTALDAEFAQEHLASADLVRRAETFRQHVLDGFTNFSNRFQRQIEQYQAQRAWKIMLAIAQAYTLWFRRGWKGKLKFFRFPFDLVAGRGRLHEQELWFPDVWTYAPDDLGTPLTIAEPSRGGTTAAPARRFDVFVLPVFDVAFRFQRPQQIAAQFARLGHRVFWVSPGHYLSTAGDRPYELFPLKDNVWEVRIRGEQFDLYQGPFTEENARTMLTSLEHVYRDQGVSTSVVLAQFPSWRPLALGMCDAFGARIVYDAMDDWRNWKTKPFIGQFTLDEEARLVQECDVVVASSAELQNRHSSSGKKVILLKNAADFQFFNTAATNSLLEGIPRPIVGYYGAISGWFDLNLVAEAARLRPQYSFVLIGAAERPDLAKLEALPNVRLMGEKAYRTIASYLRNFDVCLIPFVLDSLTRAVDPVKLYEYLSQGKPVVATRMTELEQHADLLYLADGPEDFVRKLDAAVNERDDALREKRMRFAAGNTWEKRVEQLDAAIARTLPLVSILIVAYNSEEFIEPCLDSIFGDESYPSFEVVVVDNLSKDGTWDLLGRYAARESRLHTFRAGRNLGFAGGNNYAAEQARGEYLVLLNADTIVTAGWLGRLMRPLRSNPETGMTTPVTNWSGNETKINIDYHHLGEMEVFSAELARRNWGKTTEIENAALLCVMLPASLWKQTGGLDERYAVGMFEDDDFSFRLRQAGRKIVIAEDCFLHHFGSGSFAKLDPDESKRIFDENRERYEKKWNTRWTPHRLRTGVLPPMDAQRFQVAEFVKKPE